MGLRTKWPRNNLFIKDKNELTLEEEIRNLGNWIDKLTSEYIPRYGNIKVSEQEDTKAKDIYSEYVSDAKKKKRGKEKNFNLCMMKKKMKGLK